jgi:gliding motility-associated-like protein
VFKVKNTIILLIIFLAGNTNVQAHHIIGGELYYTDLGNNLYQVTLIVYRDCTTGVAFDSQVEIGIFDIHNRLVDSLVINNYAYLKYNNDSLGPCVVVPPTVCVDQAAYQANIKLPPIAGGYILEWQRCCRNDAVLNIDDPSETGATWAAVIPDPSVASVNSSPRFNNYPPTIICQDKPLVVDQSAFDPDGDSLSYSLITPLNGGSTSVPIPTPVPPPYDSVIWANNYNRLNQLGGNPRMSIDPKTGILIAYPSTQGRFAVGIIVYEYRNKKLIGFTTRDFAFNVTSCSPKVVPSYSSNDMRNDTTFLCGSTTVTFSNSSTNQVSGAPTYHWDFGVKNLTDDTSDEANPTYTYPQILGTYIVTMIANPGEICSDTTYGIVLIQDTLKGNASGDTVVCSGNPVQLHASGGSAYLWTPSSTINNPSIANPIAKPIAPTNYHVTIFLVGQCVDTASVAVSLLPPATKPNAGLGVTINQGDSIQLHGSASDDYYWTPSSGLNSANILNPEASPLNSTFYKLIDSAKDGCISIDSVLVEVTHDHYIFAPNAFTPNNDGRNDYFTFYTKGISKIMKFEIFNRWGQMLFQSTSAAPGWNGTYQGAYVQPGSYVYLIQAMTYDNTVVTKAGDVIVIE